VNHVPFCRLSCFITSCSVLAMAVLCLHLTPFIHRAEAQEVLSLLDARQLAMKHNNLVKLANSQIVEKQALVSKMKARLFPIMTVGGFGAYNTNPLDVRIKAGDFNYLLNEFGGTSGPLGFLAPLPAEDITLVQSSSWPFVAYGTVIQPLSMLPRIQTGVTAAKIETEIAHSGLDSLEKTITSKVDQSFCGILLADAEIAATQAEINYTRSQLAHGRDGVELGEILPTEETGLEVELLDAEMKREKALAKRKQLTYDFNLLTGRPIEAEVALHPDLPPPPTRYTLEEYLQAARTNNPDLMKAEAQVALAEQQIISIDQGDIPEIYAFGSLIHQEGTPVVEETFGLIGLAASWDLYDFGKTDAERLVGLQQKIQAKELEHNTARVLEKNIASLFSQLTHADALIALATKNKHYRRLQLKLAQDQVEQHQELDTKELEARWELAEAEAELKGALIKRFLALEELGRLADLDNNQLAGQ